MAEVTGPVVKICGVRSAELAQVAVDAGSTAIGFMLAESRRRVTLDDIVSIRANVEWGSAQAVGVVVNEDAATLANLRERATLDVLQLSGDEDPGILDEVDGTIWKSLRFQPGTTEEDALRLVDPWFAHQHPVELVLVDAFVRGVFGGSGHMADWSLARVVAERYPIVLAGGLTPENVSGAIAQAVPLGVDVSSGVETNGTKDAAKIEAFVSRARVAYEG